MSKTTQREVNWTEPELNRNSPAPFTCQPGQQGVAQWLTLSNFRETFANENVTFASSKRTTTVRVPNITWTVFAIRTLHNQGLLGRSQITFSASLRAKWTWPHTFTILLTFIQTRPTCWFSYVQVILLIGAYSWYQCEIRNAHTSKTKSVRAPIVQRPTSSMMLLSDSVSVSESMPESCPRQGKQTISLSTPHHVGLSCPPGVCSDKTTENNRKQ